jgi:hypothetical protein
MLKAFTDDSGSDPQSKTRGPVFVMAGYLASIEAWNSASNDWQTVLKTPREIEYFKSTGVQNRSKPPFKDWEEEDAELKAEQLSEVIKSAQLTSFVLCMYWDAFIKAQQEFLSTADLEPYDMLFGGVMATVTKFIVDHRSSESVQFEFDEQSRAGQRALSAYWDAKEMLPRPEADLITGVGFGDDKKVLPLQMADMLAWSIRRYIYHNGEFPRLENGVAQLQNPTRVLSQLLKKETLWRVYDYPALREMVSRWDHFQSGRLSPEDIRKSLESERSR